MDPVAVLWATTLVLPVIFITALCIGCRRKIPVHITETGYYDDKVQYNPPSSSFIVMKGPSGNIMLPRTSTSQTFTSHHQEMSLAIPRSPLPPESRRSPVGREMKGLPPPKNQAEEEDDDHGYEDDDDDDDDPYYSNDSKSTRGYIEVLPDDSSIKPTTVETGSSSSLVNQESLSSAIYVNVDDPAESKEESLEYVNVDEVVKPPSSTLHGSDDDDLPDYENMGNDTI